MIFRKKYERRDLRRKKDCREVGSRKDFMEKVAFKMVIKRGKVF